MKGFPRPGGFSSAMLRRSGYFGAGVHEIGGGRAGVLGCVSEEIIREVWSSLMG